MKIVLTGYYGSDNIGDELLFQAIKNMVLKYIPSADLFGLGCFPRRATELHGIPFANNTGWWNVETQKKPTFAKGEEETLKGCDLLILGGGGLLGNDCLYSFPSVEKINADGGKIFAMGIGCDPFFSNSPEIDKYFKKFTFMSGRDSWSVSNLSKAGAINPILSFDSVFSLFPEEIHNSSEKIGLTLTTFRRWDNYEKRLEIISEKLKHSEKQIEIYPWSPILCGDYDWSRSMELFEKYMPWATIVDTRARRFEDVWDDFKQYGTIISDRYHAILLGILQNKPTLSIAMDSKQREIAKMLGLPWIDPLIEIGALERSFNLVVAEIENNKIEIIEKTHSGCNLAKRKWAETELKFKELVRC